MSKDEAEKAAREWVETCADYTLSCEAAFLAGVEWERDRMRDVVKFCERRATECRDGSSGYKEGQGDAFDEVQSFIEGSAQDTKIQAIVLSLLSLSEDSRVEVFKKFCCSCGWKRKGPYPICHCENDE